MRARVTLASLALVAAGGAGCGSEDAGAPTDATQADFCSNFEEYGERIDALAEEEDLSAIFATLKEAADDMRETGTPGDMPDDAREGFDLTMSAIDDLNEDGNEDQLDALGEGFTDEDQKKVDAFNAYLDESCEI